MNRASIIKGLRKALADTPSRTKDVPVPRDVAIAALQQVEEFARRTNASDAREELRRERVGA